MFPKIRDLIICEEKYSFTPDTLKSATRKKRQKNDPVSIAHLKQEDDIISYYKLSKSAVISTGEGKKLISNYLARTVSSLTIKRSVKVIVDSELIGPKCSCETKCSCIPSYTHPIQANFGSNGFQKQQVLDNICQRKGEAELAQVDWLKTAVEHLGSNESILAVVTSGDIDSVVDHMLAVSNHWPRNADGSFKYPVHVLLQKSKPELYNITGIVHKLEDYFEFRNAAMHIAFVLCMGGNDFVPKMFGMGRDKWMTTVLKIPDALQNIIQCEHDDHGIVSHASVNKQIYTDVIKNMYCPKSVDVNSVSVEEVRQMSVKIPNKTFRPPTSWMPPESAIDCLTKLLNCVSEYLLTAWDHSAVLPEFLGRGCLLKDQHGEVLYDFGNDSKVEDQKDLISINKTLLLDKIKTSKKNTKRPLQTPEKDNQWKRRSMRSTPVKMRRKKNTKRSLQMLTDPVETSETSEGGACI